MIVCRQERAKSAGVRQLLGSILASVPNACTHTNIKVILRAVVRYVTLDTRLKCRIPLTTWEILSNWIKFLFDGLKNYL